MAKENREKPAISVIVIVIAIVLSVIAMVGNIISSFCCAEYGLTPPEMMREVYLAIFYVAIGIAGAIFINRAKIPRPAIFAAQLALAMFIISAIHNQFAVSRELAPLKKEFAVAAAYDCKLKTQGELNCGNAVKEVLKKRDQKLSALGAVSVNNWHVSMMRTKTTMPERSGVYLLVPFL